MRLLIFSDIHDHLHHFHRLVDRVTAPSAVPIDAAIGCGDYCAPFAIAEIGEAFPVPVHLVWGNNDGDRAMQERVAQRFDHVHLEGEFMDRAFGECRVFANHYPGIARTVAEGKDFGLILYGHDHTAHAERLGQSLLLNPGSIMGYQAAAKNWVVPTASIFDTAAGKVETLYLE